MQRKEFKSKLFRKIITIKDPAYWEILYADVLFRMKVLDDLNCKCSLCFRERIKYKNLIKDMTADGLIPDNPKPKNFTGEGDCGRRLGPAA